MSQPVEHLLNITVATPPAGGAKKWVTIEVDGGPRFQTTDEYRVGAAAQDAEDWRSRTADEDHLETLSLNLHDMLFTGLLPRVKESWQAELAEESGVRLVLRLEEKLRTLPWELARNPGFRGPGQHDAPELLIEVKGLSIVRWNGEPTPREPVEGDLSVVLALGHVGGLERLPAGAHMPMNLVTRLNTPQGFSLTPTADGCTYDEALEKLAAASPHVFEFLGHAAMGGGTSSLTFRDDHGGVREVGVREFGTHLSRLPDLRIAIFAACNTGQELRGSGYGSWNGLTNIPVIVAMQREIELGDAMSFSHAFLTSLGTHGSVDAAMSAGRMAIKSQIDRATPILFMHGKAGPLAKRGAEGRGDHADWSGGDGDESGNRTPHLRPIVRANPQPGKQVKLQEFLDGLRREVVIGDRVATKETGAPQEMLRAITPYFGPGALRVGGGRDGEFPELIWWDHALPIPSGDLGSSNNVHEDSSLGTFLRKLVLERQGDRQMVLRPDSHPASPEASHVRTRLATLAHMANRLVIASAQADGTPVSGLDRSVAPVPVDHGLLEELAASIVACRAARQVAEAPLMGPALIAARLAAIEREVSAAREIRWETAVWLTDLLWHVIICDSPLYPRVEELAMQVSVLQGENARPTRRLEPSSVMSPGTEDLGLLSEACRVSVRRGFKVDEPLTSRRRNLFAATSELLRHQYQAWYERVPRQPVARNPRAAAIALTTTFDLELERALAADSRPYHVAVPVYVTSENRSAGSDELRWLVGTFEGSSSAPTVAELSSPVGGTWQSLASLGTTSMQGAGLLGPLVIKLNGSPLHAIPESSLAVRTSRLGVDRVSVAGVPGKAVSGSLADQAKRQAAQRAEEAGHRADMQHAIALGEFDFLQAMRVSLWSIDASEKSGDVGLPPWLCDELFTRSRYWLLVGHRLADWSSRTQIFTLLMNDRQLLEGAQRRGVAVALEFDEDRLRFHEWLGLQRAQGDAGDLADAFRELLAQHGGSA